jgi:hypothetical protein
MRRALQHMRGRGYGRFVDTASGVGAFGMPAKFAANLGEACAIAEWEEAPSFSSADFAEGVARSVERRQARFLGR